MKKLLVFAVAMFCVPYQLRSELSEDTKLLFKAVYEGDVLLAQKALATGHADKYAVNEAGDTPLSLAMEIYGQLNGSCAEEKKDFVQLIGLLEPPMSEERVKFLLKVARSRGTSSLRDFFPCINARDENGYTPLHYAAAGWLGDSRTACEELLSYGADVTATDYRGKRTPFDIAIFCSIVFHFFDYCCDRKEGVKVSLFDTARFIKKENPSDYWKEGVKVSIFDAARFTKMENLAIGEARDCLLGVMLWGDKEREKLQSRTEEKKSIKSNL